MAQIPMPNNHRSWIPLMQFLKQLSHRYLLLSGTSIGWLSAGVESALITYSYRVFVVVQAVCSYHILWAAWLNISVTTDNVVVTDAELVMSVFAVPSINLSGRA